MQSTFLQYISIVLIILSLVMLARKLRVAYPIVLVLGGLVIGFIPGVPMIEIDPELIFLIFLPPLLYEAAWATSWKVFWKYRRIITSFAFLIVIVTSFVVALVASSLIPGFTLALGFLLGGIVSPPDAVSATTILRSVKAPKAVTAILEGESLLNDASSLIVFRFALVAVDTGRFIFADAAVSFVSVIAMGTLIGLTIGFIYYLIHRYLPTTSHIDIVLTFTAPYIMYMVAEYFHFSGVLAVVSGGLFLANQKDVIFNHRSRMQAGNVWATIGFVLNGFVFILIGLELPLIIDQLGSEGLSNAIKYGLLISIVLIITRLICALGASVFTRVVSKYIRTADNNPGWRGPLIFGWAGMRGVVSLAAALSIPVYLTDGSGFPQRNMILFITFMVILVTLVFQGLTLPALIKWVKAPELGNVIPEEKQEAIIREKLSIVINDESFATGILDKIQKQRALLKELNKKREIDEEIIRKYSGLLDMEEEKIRIKYWNE
jgi:monovalent cation/hydrogen antiporter